MARPRSQGAGNKLTPLEDGSKAPRRTARLEGTLVVSAPSGPCELRTLFDTGSEADAVSYEKALELKQHGVGWGESGGSTPTQALALSGKPHCSAENVLSEHTI